MNEQRARQILHSLVQGVDPHTGTELPAGTVLQSAEVLRALLAGVEALEQTAARAQRRALLPGNVGRSWTTEEETELVAQFQAGETVSVMAEKHGRTPRAIEARLEKLGLIDPGLRIIRDSFTAGAQEDMPDPVHPP